MVLLFSQGRSAAQYRGRRGESVGDKGQRGRGHWAAVDASRRLIRQPNKAQQRVHVRVVRQLPSIVLLGGCFPNLSPRSLRPPSFLPPTSVPFRFFTLFTVLVYSLHLILVDTILGLLLCLNISFFLSIIRHRQNMRLQDWALLTSLLNHPCLSGDV